VTNAVLIAGAGGMLGTSLRKVCLERGVAVAAPGEDDFDITEPAGVTSSVRAFAREHPDGVVVNAAAYTNVERAEDEPERAYAVNDAGARLLAAEAVRSGLRFVHVSTDFVFDGTKAGAYTEDDVPNPLSVYGRSKLLGERSVAEADPRALIVRTAWAFGEGGVNFPRKILERAQTMRSIDVVCDEKGSPTYTSDLAAGILALLEADARGLFHLAGSGSCTRNELAREVLRLASLANVEIVPVPSSAFPTKAARPVNSVLDCSKAMSLGVVMPDWHDALARFMGGLR
jgi:dTDP-4-dehydrorhamnose reductase